MIAAAVYLLAAPTIIRAYDEVFYRVTKQEAQQCDEDNNPSAVIDAGQIIAEIDVAPTIPFEFIRFRLGRTVEAVEITE